MSSVGVGLSQDPNPQTATTAAIDKAMRTLRGDADFIILHATEGYDPSAVSQAARAAGGGAALVGCVVPGVIAEGHVTHTGVAAMAYQGSGLRVSVLTQPVGEDSRRAGAALAEQALDIFEADTVGLDPERTLLLVLPDAITGNAAQALFGLNDALGGIVPVAGGGSGDDLKFIQTWQFANDAVLTGSIVAIAIRSDVPLGAGLRHGCQPWGPLMNVTRAEGRTVHELDWKGALSVYVENARAQNQQVDPDGFVGFAMLHPLGIPHGADDYVLRSPLQIVDGESIFCCSDLPDSCQMRLMEGSPESLLRAAREASSVATKALPSPPSVALLYTCVSRDFVLGGKPDETSVEARAVEDVVNAPVFGALTFGQLGSLDESPPQFHSKSIQVVALP